MTEFLPLGDYKMISIQRTLSILVAATCLYGCSQTSTQSPTSSSPPNFVADSGSEKPIKIERGSHVAVNTNEQHVYSFKNTGGPANQLVINITGPAIEQGLLTNITMDVNKTGATITDQSFEKSATGLTTKVGWGATVATDEQVSMNLYFNATKVGNGSIKIKASPGDSGNAANFLSDVTVYPEGQDEQYGSSTSTSTSTTTTTTTTTETTTSDSTSTATSTDTDLPTTP